MNWYSFIIFMDCWWPQPRDTRLMWYSSTHPASCCPPKVRGCLAMSLVREQEHCQFFRFCNLGEQRLPQQLHIAVWVQTSTETACKPLNLLPGVRSNQVCQAPSTNTEQDIYLTLTICTFHKCKFNTAQVWEPFVDHLATFQLHPHCRCNKGCAASS